MRSFPDSWVTTLLSEIAFIKMGQSPDSRSYNKKGDGLPFFQGKAEFGKLFPKVQKWCTEPKKIAETGDILLSVRAPVGPTNVAAEPCCIGRGLAAIQAYTPLNKKYLLYYFQNIESWLIQQGTGSTFAAINSDFIRGLEVPIAPLNEQTRIADKLDALLMRVDTCYEKLERIPIILKSFRLAVLAAATSGQLTEDWRTSHEWTQWQRMSLSEICLSITDGDHQAPPQAERGVPFITIAAINDGRLRINKATRFVPSVYFEDLKTSRKAEMGDILFSVTGSIAISALVDTNEPFAFQRHIAILKPDLSRISSKFLLYSLRTEEIKTQTLSVATGTAQLTIPLSGLRTLIIGIPTRDEQDEIVSRVEALFAYADRLEARYQKAYAQIKRLKSALLDKAFRGELVPQNPNDEPVSVLLERIHAEKNRMETERKNMQLVRRPTKESQKDSMKQSSDYLKALRSAFVEIGRKADARQLFDQAGFSKDEVVQFYEALRATPEVQVVFEESVEERPQQQSSIIHSTDKTSITNGRFRLVELWLEDFKNLSDYTVCFDPSHSIDIVLGWNGTGKSNLFEALVIIFRDLHEWVERNRWSENPMKGYRLRYQMNELTVEVSWLPGDMKRPKLKMGILQEGTKEPNKLESISRGKLPLPRFVFGYYSGPTNRLAEHFLPMKQAHYTRLREATSDDPETLRRLLEQRQFFCAENHHAKYVLLAFCHKEDADISRFLEERLRIIGFESALFIIRKPAWARKGQTAEDFWGATGIMRRVMERLRRFAIAPMVVEQTVSDGYRSRREDHYYFFLPDLQSLHAFAAEYQDARTFFLALESTDFSELIYDLKLQVRVKATNTQQVAITFHELSEGEQQLLMVLGLMRFTKSHQSLVLLDEPDTHLNPHWSVEYLKLLTRVMSEDSSESEEQQTSQILMSTHDPLVIASLVKEQIHLLKRDWQTGVCKWDQPTVNPRGLGFTGILTSEMFGMRSDLDEETLADLDNKVRLVAKEDSLSPDEVAELEQINKRLEEAGFQKAFSDPYYAAFVRAWGRRHSKLMAGLQFLSPEKQEEIDRIAREVLEEVIGELQTEVMD
ncbi:restriction endonuclease subunit S [Nostoc sp. FACHB-973]|nr:restriction endonuclease subunit S [Nostoc sp. FACHB-973]